MSRDPYAELVGALIAAFPRAEIPPETVSIFVRSLRDLPVEEVSDAIGIVINTSEWFPTIAEIRQVIARRRLAMPDPVTAWENVSAYAYHRPDWIACPDCGGEPPALDHVCPRCGDEGRVDRSERPSLHPVVGRALASIGGTSAVRDSERPGILRSQFLKAYELLTLEAVRALAEGPLSRSRSASPALEPPDADHLPVESGETR